MENHVLSLNSIVSVVWLYYISIYGNRYYTKGHSYVNAPIQLYCAQWVPQNNVDYHLDGRVEI